MQLVGCQTDIVWEQKAPNYDRVRSMLAASAIKPGALVVLPEMFATGFSMHVDTIAEATDGPTHQFLAELARQLSSYVLAGVVTRGKSGRGRNEAVVFNPQGKELTRYCKMQPFTLAGEKKHYEAGEGIILFEWHDFRVAPFICYDLRFPELFRRAARDGAEVLIVTANWPQPRESHWVALLRSRAIENQCYVMGVNRSGSDPHIGYGGRSLVIDPHGKTVAEAGEGAEVLIADIDRAPLVQWRQQFPALADIRGDLLAD